jgi:hypothetical protein
LRWSDQTEQLSGLCLSLPSASRERPKADNCRHWDGSDEQDTVRSTVNQDAENSEVRWRDLDEEVDRAALSYCAVLVRSKVDVAASARQYSVLGNTIHRADTGPVPQRVAGSDRFPAPLEAFECDRHAYK